MIPPRVIPCLLLKDCGLYKTVRFSRPRYVGDPVNVVRIFNDKEVDEIIVLDIAATTDGTAIAFELLGDLATEAFMPMCYGGGIRTLDDCHRVFQLGIEKVCLNTVAVEDPSLVTRAADAFGSQSVVVAIDVARRRFRGAPTVRIRGGRIDSGLDPIEHARAMEAAGAGELLVTSIDREGTGSGFDLDLVGRISDAVGVPAVAHGGAGELHHMREALERGASAVAAGSAFVFHGRHRAVLVSYPEPEARMAIALPLGQR